MTLDFSPTGKVCAALCRVPRRRARQAQGCAARRSARRQCSVAEGQAKLADLQMIADIKLPGVTFERAGTGVMTHTVVLEKQTDAAKAPHQSGDRDFSRVDDIGELFDRLENIELAKRPLTEAELAAEQAESEASKKTERPAKAAKPEVDMEAAKAAAGDLPIVEHTTAKGKLLKGVVREDLSREQAKAIDEFTFSKDGGYFIRAPHLTSEAYKKSLGAIRRQS